MTIFKSILATLVIPCSLASCTLIHTGCKKTVEEDKVEHKAPDGTTVKDEHKVKQDDNGNVNQTDTHSVNK